MGSYTDEPKQETAGRLIVRTATCLLLVWISYSGSVYVYPNFAAPIAFVCAAVILLIGMWRARKLYLLSKQERS
jgi:amino acid permease